MLDITIAIPVYNEEKNLANCLKAIGDKFVKKIVIIDSGSTDNTLLIAKEYEVDVIDFIWDGKFPKKRNWFLKNYKPKTKWVLFLDADEYLTPEFKVEFTEALKCDHYSGYWLNYSVYFLGKQLRGGYPLQKLALFKVGAGEYERIDEERWSKLDMEIHEHPVIEGKIGVIKSKIDHQDFRGVSHYVTKHNEYSSWEAFRYLKFTNGNETYNRTLKQRLKYRLMRSAFIGPFYFIGSFFLLGGFKDGARGFIFAILKMAYFTQIYCKIKEEIQKQS
ncbi:MAG: glycosyl transferase family 2 [Mucilaginibacter sp.]|nr:glycosyl transferase family 2 [Mucilaginibacter sp.]